MTKLSTKNLDGLPDIKSLQSLCKSISVLDAIICPEWDSRYYSYNKRWGIHEEYFEMRNGSGDHLIILFNYEGAVINGMAHESVMSNKVLGREDIWKGVVDDLDQVFDDFIFGEPVKSIGTTFCIWRRYSDIKWNVGDIKYPDNEYFDGSEDLLRIYDGKPETYLNWALDYFELPSDNKKLTIESVKKIYEGIRVTKELACKINPKIDLEKLKEDLDEIGYGNEL